MFEAHRRIVLTASMLKIEGKVQREGEVVHLIAHKLEDLSPMLASLGRRGAPFPLSHSRADEGWHGQSAPDSRERRAPGLPARDIYIPDLHIDTLKQKTRDFR